MLAFETIYLLSEELGGESCLPDFTAPDRVPFFQCDLSVPERLSRHFGQGFRAGMLPYRAQESYSRGRMRPRAYRAAVLENECLRAVFLPELGGRLWSLKDKRSGRGLVYENDGVRFGNLAVCGAWFAGGVEWNAGVRGHSPLTCRPLFAGRAAGADGREMLHMYGYEAIRGAAYRLLACLDGERLVVRVCVHNPKARETPMYWWSNIALAQNPDVRVYVPARKAIAASYREGGYHLSYRDASPDILNTTHSQTAVDYFFDLPERQKRWMAVYDSRAKDGLMHASSDRLFGRKSFLWGTAEGGRHWNEWLTGGKSEYFEAQAGLAATQFEHFPMPGQSDITWTEVYSPIGPLEGADEAETMRELERRAPDAAACDGWFEGAVCERPVLFGSARGYIHQLLTGTSPDVRCDWRPERIAPEERYYIDLLQGKPAQANAQTAFTNEPGLLKYMLGKARVDEYDEYLAAVCLFSGGQYEACGEHLKRSLALGRNACNLAAAALYARNLRGDFEEALALAEEAFGLARDDLAVARLYAETAIACGEYARFAERFEEAPLSAQRNGRMQMYMGLCLARMGEKRRAREYVREDLVIPDMREGEISISDLWEEVYADEKPLPYALNFRMHGAEK